MVRSDSEESLLSFKSEVTLQVLILAAGKGTRMRSQTPKVLFEIAGYPMLYHVIKVFKGMDGIRKVNVLTGYRSDMVREKIKDFYDDIDFYLQEKQLGTGHAVRCFLDGKKTETTDILIACGDTPLLESDELKRFMDFHGENNNVLSVMSMIAQKPFGYGRIIRKEDTPVEIVEEKDADESQRKINEVNSGIYIIKESFLRESVELLDSDNSQGEFYLTDLVKICHKKKLASGIFTGDMKNLEGINDIKALSVARKEIHRRINEQYMHSGVDIYDPDSTFIDPGVEIGSDVRILPFTVIKKGSHIPSGSLVEPFSEIGPGKIKNHFRGD